MSMGLSGAAMVGGLALSRAIRKIDEPASADILRAVGNQLRLLLSVPAKKRPRK
jgi:hypothetical protein